VIRATLDANVLASGFTRQAGASGQIIARWRARQFALVLSGHMLRELARALSDPYFATRPGSDEPWAVLMELSSVAFVVEPIVDVHGVATHPEDDIVLSTALSGQATVLCTRDKQLLKLRSHQQVAILSPGEFLAALEAEESPRGQRVPYRLLPLDQIRGEPR
jgi:putative PIN family toxin of toxin-antitoxin system